MSLVLSGTDGLSDVDGTAAAPAIRGTDTNTGIFFGTDIIGFSEGGVESARFNADAQFVAAAGTAALPVITTTGDVNTGIFFPAADTVAVSTGGTERARITSTGDVGIGNSAPTTKLDVTGTVTATAFAGSGASLTTLNASNLSSGTVATARLATGTANSTTFLRGDSTWATVSGGVTSLNGETGAITNTSLYAIGSYISGRPQNITAYSANTTIAGSSLYGASCGAAWDGSAWERIAGGGSSLTPTAALVNTGTWRCMSAASQAYGNQGLTGIWVRIS